MDELIKHMKGDAFIAQRIAVAELATKLRCVFYEGLARSDMNLYFEALLYIVQLADPKTNAHLHDSEEELAAFYKRLIRYWQCISHLAEMPQNKGRIEHLLKVLEAVHARTIPLDTFEKALSDGRSLG